LKYETALSQNSTLDPDACTVAISIGGGRTCEISILSFAPLPGIPVALVLPFTFFGIRGVIDESSKVLTEIKTIAAVFLIHRSYLSRKLGRTEDKLLLLLRTKRCTTGRTMNMDSFVRIKIPPALPLARPQVEIELDLDLL